MNSMDLQLTWYGHATWMLRSGKHRILIDPFLSENPSATTEPDDLEADFILITHGHFDHVADAAAIAKRCQATLVANFEIASWFAEKHQVKKTIGMNLGGGIKLDFGRLKMTLAWHSSQLPDGSYGGNPGGYLLETSGQRIYFAGDTALFADMSLIGEGGLDVAVLPIGDLFTMGPEDSVQAVKLLGVKHVFPSHFNTWPPIEQDAQRWAELVKTQTSAHPHLPEIGQPVNL